MKLVSRDRELNFLLTYRWYDYLGGLTGLYIESLDKEK